MTKLIKVILMFVVIAVLVLATMGVIFFNLVDPNQFKSVVANEFKAKTGRRLIIDGDIKLRYFPGLSIEVNDVSVGNPPGFGDQPFAQIGQARMNIRLWSLFLKELVAKDLVLRNAYLHFVTSPTGRTNWKDWGELTAQQNAIPTHRVYATHTSGFNVAYAGSPKKIDKSLVISTPVLFDISSLKILDSGGVWDDQNADRYYLFRRFTLTTGRIRHGKAFPIYLRTDVQRQAPQMAGTLRLEGSVILDPLKKLYQVSNIKIETDLQGKLSKDHDLQALAQGNLRYDGNSNLLVIDHVTVSNKHFALHAGNANIQLSSLTQFPVNMQLRGDLNVPRLRVNQINAKQVKLDIQSSRERFSVLSFLAAVYDGEFSATGRIDFQAGLPKVQATGTLNNVSDPKFFQALGIPMTGKTNMILQLSALGLNQQTIMNSLTGFVTLKLNNGVIEGIDLPALMRMGLVLLRGETPEQGFRRGGSTSYERITTTFTLRNGLATSDDFLLESPQITVKAQGKAYLLTKRLDYHVQVYSKKANGGELMVPVRVTGPFDQPKIRLDQDEIFKMIAKGKVKQFQKKIGDKVRDTIKNILPQ